nr:MAG TPA: hypothetical protein [Caudoviricetes sp.]
MKTISAKRKTLPTILKELPLGDHVTIKPSAHSIVYVRQVVADLKRRGYIFEATEKGIPEGIKVTRLK